MVEPDLSNFSTSSSHRLPTISASQALENASTRAKSIPTSLPTLDAAFASDSFSTSAGLPRGHLTEIYGPPGVGKTTFTLQLAVNALHDHDREAKVTWIDTSTPIPGSRLKTMLARHIYPPGQDPPSSPPVTRSTDDLLTKMTYFHIQTLPHLLTLFLHPTSKFPPPQTSLIILDNVSSLFVASFPTSSPAKASSSVNPESARKSSTQWAANRKWAVAGDLASAMAKMAAIKNIAIVTINQVSTSLKGVRRAVLKPSMSGNAWEAAIHHRIVLFQDIVNRDSNGLVPKEGENLRFAQILKLGGKAKSLVSDEAVPFVIEDGGLREIRLSDSPMKSQGLVVEVEKRSWKRKADEIADSGDEGEELAWDDEFGVPEEELLREALEQPGDALPGPA